MGINAISGNTIITDVQTSSLNSQKETMAGSIWQETKPNEVTAVEGAKLIGKGFIDKAKNIFTTIKDHPVKTLAVVAGTAALIAAAPLIGVSSAVAASVLTLGFAAVAVGKTVYHAVDAAKHEKNEEYDELRKDLHNIGGDVLDLAMTAPFIPKALKTVKHAITYAPAPTLTKISSLKELGQADLKIEYETIANEMGFKTKPKLVFEKINPRFAGEFEPVTGTLKLNSTYTNIAPKKMFKPLIRHELEHYKQFSDIARAKGVDGLKGVLKDYHLEIAKHNGMPQYLAELSKNMVQENGTRFNTKFYEAVVKEQGTLLANSDEAANAQIYANGFMQKITTQSQQIIEAVETIKKTHTGTSLLAKINMTIAQQKAFHKIYVANPIEVPAFAAQKAYTKAWQMSPDTLTTSAAADAITQ